MARSIPKTYFYFLKENPLVLPLVLLKLFLDYLETRQQITTAALESPF
jgi:hypothetical protein